MLKIYFRITTRNSLLFGKLNCVRKSFNLTRDAKCLIDKLEFFPYKIGFYHSACGGNWTETSKGDQHLQMEEELCCRFEKGRSEYFRCTGGHFRKSCSGDQPGDNEIGEGEHKICAFVIII